MFQFVKMTLLLQGTSTNRLVNGCVVRQWACVHVVVESGESWVRLYSRTGPVQEQADSGYDITAIGLVRLYQLNTCNMFNDVSSHTKF